MRSKKLLPFIISFLLLTAVLFISQQSFNEMKHYTEQVDHARIIINHLSKVSDDLKSAEIFTIKHDGGHKQYYRLYKLDALRIEEDLKQLKEIVTDKNQANRIIQIDTLIKKQFPVLIQRNIAQIIESGEAWRLAELFKIHSLINITSDIEIKELDVRKQKLAQYTKKNQTVKTIFFIIAFALIISSFLYSLFLARKRQWLQGFLESILNTTQNGIIYFKAKRKQGKVVDFEVAFANLAIEKHLYIDQNKIVGKRFNNVHILRKEPSFFQNLKTVMQTGEPLEFEWKFVQKDFQVCLKIVLAKLEDGATATFQNITEIRHYQNELTRNIHDLENSNQELEQYAYVASHDLQEPLRKIRTYGAFLQEKQNDRLDETGKTYLQKIIKAAERQSILIRDILNFSSLRRELIFVATDLNNVLKNVLDDLDVSIEQSGVKIQAGQLPIIEAIPLQINQLFYNLITNAIKFSVHNPQPVVRISSRTLTAKDVKQLSKLPTDKTYCEIKFEDNGIGFDEAFAHNIFGLFKRLNDQASYPGSGIGLALCSKVVVNHSGEIFARSVEGQGAQFYVILPFQQ